MMSCSLSILASKISPLLQQLRNYTWLEVRGDVLAGLSTAVMLIPQSMAYALLAGLPAWMGLYAALVPPLFYALLGSSRQLSVGPVAMDSLLIATTLSTVAQSGSESYLLTAAVLALMVGSLQILFAALRFGFVVNFVSHPVVSGFTSAAAILIAFNQFRHLLGIEAPNASNLFVLLKGLVLQLPSTDVPTLLVALVSIGLLLALKKWFPRLPAPLFVVSTAAALVLVFGWQGHVSRVEQVPAGLPQLSLPAFDFLLLKRLLPGALTIALLGFVESISISQSYAKKRGYEVQANRELLALGVANLSAGFVQAFGVGGSFSRTAVNAQAGACSTLATIVSSASIALALLYLTPAFSLLPQASLAAIILVAVFALVDIKEARELARVKGSDLLVWGLSFAGSLSFGLIEGLAFGVFASLCIFFIRSTRPHIAVLGRVPGTTHFRNIKRHDGLITYPGVLALRMDAQFYFANISFLKNSLATLESEMSEPLKAVILDASAINHLDSSAVAALKEIRSNYEARAVNFYLSGVKGPVFDVLERAGFTRPSGMQCRCMSVHEAMTSLTLKADLQGSSVQQETSKALAMLWRKQPQI